MTEELGALEAEKSQSEENLAEQTTTLQDTTTEKETELGKMDCDIATGEANLASANETVCEKQGEVESAQCELDQAQQNVTSGQQTLESADCDLKDAVDATTEAQGCQEAAKVENEDAKATECDAKADATDANNDLGAARENTDAAADGAEQAGAALEAQTVTADEAFSVLNLRNQEVAQAQSEYNNAQAKANQDQSLWDKFKNWVSSTFNKLKDAIAGRDHAQAEAEREAKKQEKLQAASDEALAALEARKDEQDEAQRVADAAGVVLDRATQEREVTDQEYAEAVIALSDAMENQQEAEAEYNTAFDNYMELNNYYADAEGKLRDAEGNYVSATQVAEEFEVYMQGLMERRDTKETEYDNVIVTIEAAISGEEEAINNLDSQITELQSKIEQEKENIAMQEAMITAVAHEQSELNAAKSSGGIADDVVSLFGGGNAAEEKELMTKKEALNEALLSGDQQAIQDAYRAIYGDEQVYVNEQGDIVDPNNISTENITAISVSDLSATQLNAYVNNQSESLVTAASAVEKINSGGITCNGEEVSMEQLSNILLEQVQSTQTDMNNSTERQGALSKMLSNINENIGLGTSSVEAQAQVSCYIQLAEDLAKCTDPVEFAALFKELTGTDFNENSIAQLLAYDEIKTQGNQTQESTTPSTTVTDSDTTDLGALVNNMVESVNSNYGGDSAILTLTGDSKALEAIQDYKETQEAIKDGVIGVVSGVAAVVAAPFTGGASLLIAAGVGAGASLALNAGDSIYDADGDGNLDINYSWQEAGKDAAIGALNGLVGNIANGAGSAVSRGLSGAQTTLTTTTSQALRQTIARYSGYAVEGFIDGAMSAGGQYAINAASDENLDFSFDQFMESTIQGGTSGMLFNVGLHAAGDIVNSIPTRSGQHQYGSTDTPRLSDGTDDVTGYLPEGSADGAGRTANADAPRLGDGNDYTKSDASTTSYDDPTSSSNYNTGSTDAGYDNTNTTGSGTIDSGFDNTSTAGGTQSNVPPGRKSVPNFEQIHNDIRDGNITVNDALDELINGETNQKIIDAYTAFVENPSESTLKKLKRAISNEYHPDTHPNLDINYIQTYNNLFDLLEIRV